MENLRFDCAKNSLFYLTMIRRKDMKDFIKWLGVNEKVAKVVVWLFLAMAFLVMTNTMLESIGVPYYAITVENFTKIHSTKTIDYLCNAIVCLLNFYSIVFLVFKVKNFKKIFPYSILYVVLNMIITNIFGYIPSQIYILAFLIIFCFYFSGKKPKYILYCIISLAINTVIQYIWYQFKAAKIDFNMISGFDRILLSIDYFIIMGIIILVKEIVLKKRGEKKCQEVDHQVGSGLEHLKKKAK